MGSFEIVEHKNDPATITLNADIAVLSIGSQGINGGNIKLIDWEGREIFTVDGSSAALNLGDQGNGGDMRIRDSEGRQTFLVDGHNANFRVGVYGNAGNIEIYGEQGERTLYLKGPQAELNVGTSGNSGKINVIDWEGREIFTVDGSSAALDLGAQGNGGDMRLRDSEGRKTFTIDGHNANFKVGINGNGGNIEVHDETGKRSIYLNGPQAELVAGSFGNAGAIAVLDTSGKKTIRLNGSNAALYLGGGGTEGDVIIFPTTAKTLTDTKQASIVMNGSDGSIGLGANRIFNTDDIATSIFLNGKKATLKIGYTGSSDFGEGVGGKILIYPSLQQDESAQAQPTITLDGNSGDILLKNADCAEEFDITDSTLCEPGTVMVIDENEKVKASYKEYDKKVAGVISGAGKYRAGMILDKKDEQKNRKPLTLMGKVYCKVDADLSPIGAGDLLTTSTTIGHAMKASDPIKSFGSVLGKALRQLKGGKAIIPILIMLQ
jgi:hypothetical protein